MSGLLALVGCADGGATISVGPVGGAPASTTDGSTTATTGGGVTPTDVDPVDWGDCDADTDPTGDLECGTVSVPLDYGDPGGRHLDMAVIRRPADGHDDERVGSIVFNPGGPGGSGVDFVANLSAIADQVFGSDVLDRFDLVGFDPRGVDRSEVIDCVDDAWLDAHLYLDDTPDDATEQALVDDSDAEFGDECRQHLGDTAVDYSTEATARDLDVLRQAVGDAQLTYYGVSYGTYLGGVYATLFGDHVRAMVLDGAFSPVGEDALTSLSTQIEGFDGAFDDWAAWCDGDTACAFAGNGGAAARWDALHQRLDDTPLTSGGRTVNQAVQLMATVASLYSRSTWPLLAQALAAADGGDGSRLLALADGYSGRDPDGHYDGSEEANRVIVCASGLGTPPTDDPSSVIAALRELSPRFAATTDEGDLADPCADLTGDVTPVPLSYDGSGPVVVVGGTHDPATPMRWATKMTDEMHATLVTYTGTGHGAITESSCVHQIAGALFIGLTRPAEGTECAQDPPTEAPPWWSSLPELAGTTPIALEDAGGMIGLPDGYYADLLATPAGRRASDLEAEVTDAYDGAGWKVMGAMDIDMGPDSRQLVVMDGDGHLLALTIIGPDSLADESLADLGQFVTPGQGIVVRFQAPS